MKYPCMSPIIVRKKRLDKMLIQTKLDIITNLLEYNKVLSKIEYSKLLKLEKQMDNIEIVNSVLQNSGAFDINVEEIERKENIIKNKDKKIDKLINIIREKNIEIYNLYNI